VAEALKPVAGNFAFALFSIGIIGTGMLSIPVLAGSAAYAALDCCGWACSLESRPKEAIGFYSVIAIATMLGLVIEFLPIDSHPRALLECRYQRLRRCPDYDWHDDGPQPPCTHETIHGTPDARFRRLVGHHCDGGSSRGDDNLSVMLSERCDFATDESSEPITVTTCLLHIVRRHR